MIKPTTYFIGKYKVKGIENYSTLEECYEYLKDKKFIGIDIETSAKTPQIYAQFKKNKQFRPGLDPYLTKIVMLQLGNYEKIFVIDVRDYSKEELQPIINFLNYNKDITLIGQNLKFEQKHLKHNYGINFYNVVDIMIQEMCLYNGLYRSFSLAGMAKEYLGVKSVTDFSLFDLESKATLDDDFLESNEHLLTPFEIADEEQIDKGTRMEFVTIFNKPFTAKQILYGSDDILYPLLIAERQRLGRQLPNGEVYKPLTLFKLENQMVLVNADMELNGMPFKEEVWRDIEKDKHKEYTERLKELNSYVEQFYPKFVEEPNLFDFHRRCKVEWSSSKQVIELFRFLDICPKEFSKQTKKEEWTVGAVALLKLIPNELKDAYNNQQWVGFDKDDSGSYIEDHSKLILAYLLMKRSEQAVTTFGLEWLKYVHPVTGRIHSNFRQILNSGRMASNNPNCLSLDTEILTPTGWKKSNEVSVGEEAYSFNLSRKELEIQKINQVYHGRGNLIEVENNTHFNACLTDNHRNLFIDRKNGEFKVKPTNEFMKDAHILNASIFNEGINEDENFLTLLLATQADGTYHGNKIRFSFTKERKINRLKRVLDILKIDYLHNKRRNSDINEFYVSISEDYFKGYLKDKKLTYKLLNLSLSNRYFIIDEIHNWDGLYKQKSSYCSLLEENIDVLQAVHTITNTRSKVRMYKDKYFNLDITRKNYTGTANSKLTNIGEDNVWCVNVDNSFIVCRRGGTTFITGNCQNLPQGVYRDAFALDSGSVISSDFGNQEMRTAACISGEEVMLQVFTEGHPVYDDDLHMTTADSMNKALNPNAEHLPKKGQEGFTNEIKKQRDRAKIVNFGILYGKEAKGFAQDFGMELEDAEDFIKNYFKAYPKLQVMMEKQAKETFKNNYILINLITDRRWFSSLFDEMYENKEKASEYFPEEYFSNRMPKEQKLKLKEELNTMYPEIKTYWRAFFGIRGSIQRKSTNYLIQGCIPASSNILTDKGFCKIGDFESGIVWTGQNWAPANKVARGEAEIIKLTLSNGYEFICDDRHKLLGLNSKGEEQMFDVLDMVGEKIIIDLKKSNCEWGSSINSVEDWYWFGRLVGDGWVTKRGHWGIIFNKNEYDDMNAFCQWLDSKDLITKTRPKSYKGYNMFYSNSKTKKACTREESTYCSVSLSSEDSHKILKMWNIDKGFSSNKHLPPIVFSLDFERRKALFRGWYDADGRKYPSRGGIILDGKKYTRLSCSNKVLQQNLLKLTTTLGFLSKIFNYKNSADIYFYTKPQQIFVKSIDYLGYKEETYTLTVHDHLHRFSNEGLISKNTSADETKTALVMIRKNFIEKNTHLKLINSVHDEILVETTNEKEEAIKDGELLAKLMVDGANVYLTPKIMTSNPEVGSCWVH